jgi:hypothetical protein
MLTLVSGSAMASYSLRHAMWPISRTGCATVVSAG